MSQHKWIAVDKDEGFAVVSFARPERKNALIPEMLEEFIEAMTALDADPAMGAVILTGLGRDFCVGLDVDMLKEVGVTAISRCNAPAAIAGWNGPVIGAFRGNVVTGGLEIAVACDMIVASESARFIDTHSRVGLLPGWGLSARLHRLVGPNRAKELEMTGRPLHAREAADWGLVNRVVADADLIDSAKAMVRMIVAGAPGNAAATKKLIDGGAGLTLEEGLQYERDLAVNENRRKDPGTLRFDHVGGMRKRR